MLPDMAEIRNVILITSDQQRADCYGFEGRRVRTPHLDLMASQGTRFSACITPNNVCQPSRASILTGLLPNTHRVYDNGIDLDPALGDAGIAGTLNRAGVRTGFLGKAHFSTWQTFEATGTPECRSSMKDFGPDWFGPYMGFEHVELVVLGHNQWTPQKPPSGQHYEAWYYGDGLGDLKNKLYATRLDPQTDAVQTFHSALPSAWHNSTWLGDRTIEYLRNHRDERFFVWTSFPDPHHPFDAPDPWSRMHHPDDVDLPVHRTKDLDRRPWWHRASLEGVPVVSPEFRKLRQEYSRVPDQTDEQLRHLIANYYGMISLIDHNVGRIMAAVHELGLAENTLVIYTTDHGDWLGDHGLILKGPINYEGLVRVGCLFHGPGVPASRVVGDPVSTLDLAATVLDYLGVSPQADMHSRSLRPLVADEAGASRDFAYNEWDINASRCGVALDLRMVRTSTHKLTLETTSGAGELYDLANDPHEMDNRFDDPGVRAIQAEMTDMIRSRPRDEMTERPVPVGMA
jgi:arylsulfatase A-like enzyme